MDDKRRLFDADNHYYEPRDAFTRYIEPAYRDRAVRAVIEAGGAERIYVDDRPYTYTPVMYDGVAKPGALREMMRRISTGSGERFWDDATYEAMRPECVDRDSRLALMDVQGLEGCLMFPSLAVCVEHFMKDEVRPRPGRTSRSRGRPRDGRQPPPAPGCRIARRRLRPPTGEMR